MKKDDMINHLEFSIRSMGVIYQSISIIENIRRYSVINSTYDRIISANIRDIFNLIDSLHRDKYRDNGIIGLANMILSRTNTNNTSWIYQEFGQFKDEIIDIMKKKPKATLYSIEKTRRDATAHFPLTITPKNNSRPITITDVRTVYEWMKSFYIMIASRIFASFFWEIDEEGIDRDVKLALSFPILINLK